MGKGLTQRLPPTGFSSYPVERHPLPYTLQKLMADLNRLAKGTDPVNTSVVVIDEKQKEREQKEEAPTRSPSCGGCWQCGNTIMLTFRS